MMTTINAANYAPHFPSEYIPEGQDFNYEIWVAKDGNTWHIEAEGHEAEDLDELLLGVPNSFRLKRDALAVAQQFAITFADGLAEAWAEDLLPQGIRFEVEDRTWTAVAIQPIAVNDRFRSVTKMETATPEAIRELMAMTRRTARVATEFLCVGLLQDHTGKVWAKIKDHEQPWRAIAHSLQGMEREDVSALTALVTHQAIHSVEL